MKNVIIIGLDLPSNEIESYLFDSKVSLSDSDIAIFDPVLYLEDFSKQHGKFRGKSTFTIDSSFEIYSYDKHWKKEIIDFLKAGKTIFIHFSMRDDYYIHTGKKEVSGTGRNEKVTNIVENYSNYSFFPFDQIKYIEVEEAIGYPNSIIVDNFQKNFKEQLGFELYIESLEPNVNLYSSKNKDKNFSCYFKHLNGYVVLLPAIYVNTNDYYDEKKEKYTEKGTQFSKKYISNIIEIEKNVRNLITSTPKPEWLSRTEFEIPAAKNTKTLIDNNKKKIEKIESEISEQTTILEFQESLNDLLFETGKKLENAVIKGLEILGFKAENFDNGHMELDQVIVSPSGIRYIGECEGKDSKDIDISKFRQLLDSLNEDFSRPEIGEKAYGILFGNPQRLIDPSKRTLTFTDKCLRGAEREKVGLVLTKDLFTVCNYINEKSDMEFKEKCRQAIENNLGKLIHFPKVPK